MFRKVRQMDIKNVYRLKKLGFPSMYEHEKEDGKTYYPEMRIL